MKLFLKFHDSENGNIVIRSGEWNPPGDFAPLDFRDSLYKVSASPPSERIGALIECCCCCCCVKEKDVDGHAAAVTILRLDDCVGACGPLRD